MVPIPIAIMKAFGHSDLQMTMYYVSLGKSYIQAQVESLNTIPIPKNTYTSIRPSPSSASSHPTRSPDYGPQYPGRAPDFPQSPFSPQRSTYARVSV